MSMLAPVWTNGFAQALFWSVLTIGFYLAAKRLYRRWTYWWISPLVLAPALLIAAVSIMHTGYPDYIRGTSWLVALLGPATVAFAVPIYEQRALIKSYWPILMIGVVAGSVTAMLTAWALANALGLDRTLELSLLPRSISTPFAMAVSGDIGGLPDLTALFVLITGVFGAAAGEVLLAKLPIRSTLARGALFGTGAHAAGTAKAHEIGREEGSIAGLVMVLMGLCNVLAAPVLAYCLNP